MTLDITNALVGWALYILIWMKLPEWGTWFNRGLARLPKPLQTLYQQWHCPYCVGFWMGLALHGATGLWTVPALGDLPPFWGAAGPLIGWFLDALVTGTLMLVAKLALDAIGLPAIRGHQLREEFMAAVKDKKGGAETA